MLSKEKILEDVAQFTADQLVDHIKNGVVTFAELCNDTDGQFSPSKRREVKHKLECGDEEEWKKFFKKIQ